MTSQWLSCWHLKSYRERLEKNGMIFVYQDYVEIQLQMSSVFLHWWISPEVEFTSVMTDFPSFKIDRICGVLNRLVSDVMIIWHTQRARRKMYLIPSALPNVLLVMACRWIVGTVKILNDAMEHEEITDIEIYRLKLILKILQCTYACKIIGVVCLKSVREIIAKLFTKSNFQIKRPGRLKFNLQSMCILWLF